jgi:hypothetical protein
LISCDEKRPGPARRVENAQFGRLFRRFVFQQFAHRVFDDVIDDVSGRVINAARFLNLGFIFDFSLVAFGKPDDFTEKLLINLAENVRRQNRKFVRAIGILETPDNFLKHGVIDFELGREIVRRLNAIFFFLKIKQTGVVPLIGFAKELVQPAIRVFAVEQRL